MSSQPKTQDSHARRAKDWRAALTRVGAMGLLAVFAPLQGCSKPETVADQPLPKVSGARLSLPEESADIRSITVSMVKTTQGSAQDIRVPKGAVLEKGQNRFVFIEKARGEYERHEVSLASADKSECVVKTGLEAGDQLVTNGAELLETIFEKAGEK